MRARADGADDLLGLGRREDELHVVGRLFDELEQRVEALRRHHVRLVEDEDLEAVSRRREDRPFAEVARVVDAVVRGGIDLDDVERSAAPTTQLDAAVALAAGSVGRPLGAVQAAREDARRRRLAAAARPREQVGVADPIAAQGRHERLGDLSLPDHLAERLRTVTAVEGCGHRISLGRASDTSTGSAHRIPAALLITRPLAGPGHRANSPRIGIAVVTVGTDAESRVPSSRRTSSNWRIVGRPERTGP